MATYDANFADIEVLGSVASLLNTFGAEQENATAHIVSEVQRMEQVAKEAQSVVWRRLEEEQHNLDSLNRQLDEAQNRLANCKQTDEEGNTTPQYEYWLRLVNDLLDNVEKQETVVENVKFAYNEVQQYSSDIVSRSVQIRSLSSSYCARADECGISAATTIKHCADAMQGYWNPI